MRTAKPGSPLRRPPLTVQGSDKQTVKGRHAYAWVLSTVAALALSILTQCTGDPEFGRPALTLRHEGIAHPADVVRFGDRYVVTQLYDNRLAVLESLESPDIRYFDPTDIGGDFDSPHFLAVAADGGLLVSNGWGNSIVWIDSLNASQWREFRGIGKRFHAPHGICVDGDGWIYVADSLNSRLVRFRDMKGEAWQVFPDRDRRISYIRELVCRDGAILAANSYENRPGLNPGRGANILKISDFDSGKAQVLFEFPDTNITGLLPIADDKLLVGLWGARRRLALIDVERGSRREFDPLELGTPYGMYFDAESDQVLVTHIGDLRGQRENQGGIAVYR